MSEFWIVTASRLEEHPSLHDAVHQMDGLKRHFPDQPFRVYRCKRNIRSAYHFTKLVDLLRDIVRDGLTKENKNRAIVILTTINNRNAPPAQKSGQR